MNQINIAVVSPSGTFPQIKLTDACGFAEGLGFRVISSTQPRESVPSFINGSRAERLAELVAAEQQNVDALWCVRGGCGAIELWSEYQKEIYATGSAPLIGYSDNTILHFIRFYRAARIGIHGPVFLDLLDERKGFVEALAILINKQAQNIVYPTLKPVNHFVNTSFEGPLIPMNLISLTSLAGCIDTNFLHGKILALEDVNEPHYKVFRALHHLKNAGLLTGLKALVLGHFGPDRDVIINETARPIAELLGIPLFDWPIFGHEKPNWPLLFGARVRISKVDEHFFTLTYREQHDHTLTSNDG